MTKFKIGDKVWYPDYPLGQQFPPGEKRFVGIIEDRCVVGKMILYDIDTAKCYWASLEQHITLYKPMDCPEYLRISKDIK